MVLVTRRSALLSASAVTAAAIVGKYGTALAQVPTPFTLGVASGEPGPEGFVIWTRLAPDPLAADGLGGLTTPVPVTWEVASDASMRNIVRSGTFEAQPSSAHAVHVELAGLLPNRPYWYRFMALGARSAIGRARTMPAPNDDPPRFRFAMASCANWQYGYFSAYRHMAAGNFDLVFFLGDYIYESTLSAADSLKAVRPHDGPTATTLKAYRNRHALYKTDPDLQALHASTSCLATWDDHEFANDYAGEWSQTVDTDPKAFLRRRAAAYQAYYEHMPLRPRSKPNGSSMSLHSRRRFGSLASIALLDTRQYRSIQPCALPTTRKGHVALDSCTDRLDPNRTFLGAQQEAFLYEGFHRLDTAWNLIFQSQLVAQLRRRDAEGNMGVWTDCWDGYPAARQRMLDAIASGRPSNPVFFGGDIHSFWANELKLDFNNPASRSVATEFVGTSVTSDGPSYVQMLQVLPQNPHVQFFESRYRGYMEVDLTRSRMDTRFQIITDRRNPAARVTTLRQFFVEAGRPGVTS